MSTDSCDFCEYRFSLQEMRILLSFMREHEDVLPNQLQNFFSTLESFVYNAMTIEEAERFFYEK